MTNKRKSISPSIRFDVFKRDKFRCQYCGRSAPEVILEIDHINPVANGGDNSILNLVTSCKECNRGKGAKTLSDDSSVKKQQAQLEELAERNEQLEMILKWREELEKIEDKEADGIMQMVNRRYGTQRSFTDAGRRFAANLVRKYTFEKVYDATIISFDKYFDGSDESFRNAWSKVSGVLKNQEDPNAERKRQVYYLRKILINRLSYVNMREAIALISTALENEFPFEDVKEVCTTCRNWTEFKETIEKEFY